MPGSHAQGLQQALTVALLATAAFCAQAQTTDPATSPAPAEPAPAPSGDVGKFFIWTDTSVSALPYGYGFAVDPREQSTLTIEHAHASKIGDFFGFVDFTYYHGAPPGLDTEVWYGELGPRLSFGKMSGKDLSFTLFKHSIFEVKDVLLAMQYERGNDPDVAEAALIGLGLDLNVRESGLLGGLGKFNYVQLNFYGRAELTKDTRHGFHDMQVTMVASYPFKIGRTDWLVDGYFDWVTGFGSEEWSYHLNPQVTMDVGALSGAPGKLFMGVEIDWWWNKYQIPDSAAFDTNQDAVSLLLKYHF